jgi:hypothetical protein
MSEHSLMPLRGLLGLGARRGVAAECRPDDYSTGGLLATNRFSMLVSLASKRCLCYRKSPGDKG